MIVVVAVCKVCMTVVDRVVIISRLTNPTGCRQSGDRSRRLWPCLRVQCARTARSRVSRIAPALLDTVDAHKRYATEQFVPLLSRKSRIFAGICLRHKVCSLFARLLLRIVSTRAGPCAAALKKGDVMTLISSGKAAAGLRRILLSLAAVATVLSLGVGAAQAQASRT